MMVTSCNSKKSIIGKWRMVGNGPIINFINDSTGSIKHSDTIALQKVERIKYHIINDTLFEDTPVHLYGRRKWTIYKLTKDSLIIHSDKINACYYRLQ
jgi:hypothetical protein